MTIDPSSIITGSTWLSSELPDLALVQCGTDAIEVELALSGDAEPFYRERFVPSSAGRVSVGDMSSLLTAVLEGSHRRTLLIRGGVAGGNLSVLSQSTIIYSRLRVRDGALSWLGSHFLSPLNGETRPTRLSYTEVLWASLTAAEQVSPPTATVTARYGDGSSRTFTVHPFSHEGQTGLVSYTFTPRQFADPDYAVTLAAFTVSVGARTQSYLIDFAPARLRGFLRYANAFGLADMVPILGRLTEKTTHQRSAGWFTGVYRQYDDQETTDTEVSSGYVGDGAFTLWRDCARTRTLYPYPSSLAPLPSDGVGEAVITAEKIEHSDEDDALHIVTLTYREQPSFPAVAQPYSFRVFDDTFDETFN